jgi:hypothetical protein
MKRLTKVMGCATLMASATAIACAGDRMTPETPYEQSGRLQPAFAPTAPRGSRVTVEQPAPTTAPNANQAPEPSSPHCPANVQGAEVRAVEVDGAVALEFSAPATSLRELRHRVNALALAYEAPYTIFDALPYGSQLARKRHAADERQSLPTYRARSEQTPYGARIVFTPDASSDTEALREEVSAEAEVMAQIHLCPMLSDINRHWPAVPGADPRAPQEDQSMPQQQPLIPRGEPGRIIPGEEEPRLPGEPRMVPGEPRTLPDQEPILPHQH